MKYQANTHVGRKSNSLVSEVIHHTNTSLLFLILSLSLFAVMLHCIKLHLHLHI